MEKTIRVLNIDEEGRFGGPERRIVNVAEGIKSQNVETLVLLPLLAYDKNKNRIGYGKGFYDRYLNKFVKIHRKIITVGVAFSFQKYHKLPINNKDFKLNYILTEKGIY